MKGPWQIKRKPGSEPGTYEFHLTRTSDGKVLLSDYRLKSPIPPKHLRERQATLNTAALLNPVNNGLWIL